MDGTPAHRQPVRRHAYRALADDAGAVLPIWLRLALIIEILCVYAVIVIRLRRHGVGEIASGGRGRRQFSVNSVHASQVSQEHALVARRLGWAVTRTLTVLPTDSRCLVQSLVLQRLLIARSIPSRLVIAARADGPFMAHAWVECNSVAVLPSRGYENSRLVEL
jgi:hypothetical protein